MILSDAALKRPVATSTVVFAVIIIGLFTVNRIGIDFLPKMNFPYITIFTVYPGAGPQEVEAQISKKIEDAVSEVDGIKYIRSVSTENISQVFIEFELGTDVDFAAIDVREKIDGVIRDLPDDAEEPVILKVDINAKPVMNLVLYGEKNMGELYDLADLTLRDQLSQIPGMASVDIIGGKQREIQILVDGRRLAAHGLSILEVMAAVGRENLDLPSGHITESRIEYTVRFEGEFDRVEDIARVEIPLKTGRTIKIADVANVVDNFEEQRILSRYNGTECVTLRLKKKADANTVAVVDGIFNRLDSLKALLPDGVKLEVANDDSAFVRYSVSDVQQNMIIGILLTMVILYLFLHNLRATVVAAVAIPISIVATMIPIYFAGFTLNNMTLMALALSVGVLVMNALVVLENIYRHLNSGASPYQAARTGTSEIAVAVFGSAMTNIVVFLPIAFMGGLVGQFFYEFGVSVVFATGISLLVSFTVTPILASKLAKKVDSSIRRKGSVSFLFRLWDSAYGLLEKIYEVGLDGAFRWRWLVILIALFCFFGSTRLARHIGSELITESDRAEATVTVEMPPGASITRTSQVTAHIEKIILEMPEVKGTLSTVGKIEGLFGKSTEGVHVAQILILLSDKNRREKNIEEILTAIRGYLTDIPDAKILVLQPSPIGGVEAPIQLEISGSDLDNLERISGNILNLVQQTPGTVDVDTTWRKGKPEVRIFPDRQKLADYGINVAVFAAIMRTYLEGTVVSQFRERDEEYDIRVKLREKDRSSADLLGKLLMTLPNGQAVPVSHFAKLKSDMGPTQILRKDKQRLVVVSTDTLGKALGEVAAELDAGITKINLPAGYRIHQGGMVEHMKESFTDILMAFGLAIILTYLVLAAILESYVQPFSIMLTVPLSLVGVLIGLYITKETFNIFSLMAVVMLVGIVVNNAILIIDYSLFLMAKGEKRNAAIIRASVVRLRPILMTTLAAAVAMVPLALALGWGAEMRSSMAIASIGGLLSSAVLTLFVVPVMYTYLDDLTRWVQKLFKR